MSFSAVAIASLPVALLKMRRLCQIGVWQWPQGLSSGAVWRGTRSRKGLERGPSHFLSVENLTREKQKLLQLLPQSCQRTGESSFSGPS